MKRGRLLKTTRGDVGLISVAHAARLLCHEPDHQLAGLADESVVAEARAQAQRSAATKAVVSARLRRMIAISPIRQSC